MTYPLPDPSKLTPHQLQFLLDELHKSEWELSPGVVNEIEDRVGYTPLWMRENEQR